MLGQQQGFSLFPNGSFGPSNGFQAKTAPQPEKENSKGGFSLFGLFNKPKAETFEALATRNPWQDNRFLREAVIEEAPEDIAPSMVIDAFNMAYRTLI